MSRLRPAPSLSSLSSRLVRPALAASPRIPLRTLVPSRGAAVTPKSLRNYWNADRLRTSHAYPLSKELYHQLESSKNLTKDPSEEFTVRNPFTPKARKVGKTGQQPFVRTQIVSPQLCDDVLSYYGKSLERHRGCDILDINPGAGLWSQKLHDFLQPRSHVLLEPRPDQYAPYLDPLVNAPGSRYQIVQKDTMNLDTYRQVVDENIFPHQVRVDPHSTAEQKVNDTLLITGSLNWEPRLPGLNFDSMAKQLIHHFAAAAWTNDLFHAYGRVRTLIWFQHDDIRPLLSEAVAGFQKANAFLEMTHDLELVVVAPHRERMIGRGALGREPQYEVESTVKAMARGREAGLELPKHRRELIHDVADEVAEKSGGSGISTSSSIVNHLDEKLRQGTVPSGLLTESHILNYKSELALKDKHPEVPWDKILSENKPTFFQYAANRGHPAHPEFHTHSVRRSSVRRNNKIREDFEAIANTGEEMYTAECKILSLPDGPEKTELLAKIADLEAAWEAGVGKLNKNYTTAPYSEMDDRLGLRSPPYPRLQWDRRAFEPLVARSSEVWPMNRVSLLSMEPHTRPAGVTVDWYEWLQDFVYGLFQSQSDSVSVALDKMQHGARDIVSKCPSLRDPAKGGRLNMEHLRVRMLTKEMILELLEAYRRWPFKEPGSDHNKFFRYRRGNTHGKLGEF